MVNKRINLTIEEKSKIREFHRKNPIYTQDDLARYFSSEFNKAIARRTIGNIINSASDDMIVNQNQKRSILVKSTELESIMKICVDLCIENNVLLTDLLIKAKTINYAESLGFESFKASNGWLYTGGFN
jgi:Fission yeast centromere protein N-terminal domain/Tc5 transposase DNA-binding domain